MSGQPSGSNAPSTPKAIASLAKKQPDVTRQGAQKLKFVPVLPARRKKDVEVKLEPPVHGISTEQDRGQGRGRGGDSRGRGVGISPRTPIVMTASGPFAMGPVQTGTTARRTVARSNFTPIVPSIPGSVDTSATRSTELPVKKEKTLEQSSLEDLTKNDEAEVYSDQDDGVEIVDMENIRHMDWMAPESLRKEHTTSRRKKIRHKNEDPTKPSDVKGKSRASEANEPNDIDHDKALDLNDNEDEEFEDLIEDFIIQTESGENPNVRQERLYFFQFPSPFPNFLSPSTQPSDEGAMDVDEPQNPPTVIPNIPGGSSSTPNTAQASKAKVEPDPKVDGIIGHLEVYRSGAVKMRIGNGIVLDVTAATQPSFLQHAVHLDMENKRLSVLGEVKKRFVVSPDVDTLLYAMELADLADANNKKNDD